MRRVCFVLGTPEYRALSKGELVTDWTFEQLNRVAEKHGFAADMVFAVMDTYYASRSKTDIGIERIRAERPRVLDEISAIKPDLVVCFGGVAAASVFNHGSLTEHSLQRRIHHPIPDGPPVCYTSSIEQIRMAPGMVEWWDLDISAAIKGYDKPVIENYYLNRCDDMPVSGLPPVGSLVGFDLETTGLNCWASNAQIRMAVLSWMCPAQGMVTYVWDWDKMPAWALHMVTSAQYVKVGANIGFDVKWCARFGVPVNSYRDVLTTEHVLYPGNPRLTLKDLGFKYFPQVGNYNEIVYELAAKFDDDWSLIPAESMYEYCAADGQVSLQAALAQETELQRQNDPQLTAAAQLMTDLYPILTKIQIEGACVDPGVNEELDGLYAAKLAELRGQITQHLGPINLNSTDQLAKALCATVPGIDLSPRKVRRVLDFDDREDEEVSTNKVILERESDKHPIIQLILEYRRYRVRHGTFIKGLREKHMVQHHGKSWVHPDFRSDVTDTYRLSSRNPNGQNLPKNDPDPAYSVKRQYISRFEGGCIADVDMSQIELRVAAWFSGDRALQAAFAEGRDVHREMAAPVLGKQPDQITDQERQDAKSSNFLVVYGGGAHKLAADMKIPMQRAAAIIKDYFAAYPDLERTIERVHNLVKKNLRVITPFGFRRIFFEPDRWMSSDGFSVLRQSWNTIVQNTAACLMYCAMVRCAELWGDRKSVLFVQVHDSLGVDIFPGEEQEVARILQQSMHEAPEVAKRYGVNFTLPLDCELKLGPNWGTVRKYERIESTKG